MKNDHIGLMFECPIRLKKSDCPFQMFRKEKDAMKRVGMWESINFSYKLAYHKL